MIKLIETKEGTVAVFKHDTHLSRWVEEHNSLHTDGSLTQALKLIKPGSHVVDAGACIGDWTVPLSKHVGPGGRVYAFEPMPWSFACLAVNTRDLDNTEIHCCGLSSHRHLMGMVIEKNVGASYVSHSDDCDVMVCLRGLDSFEFPAVDFLKIDVEGRELSVIAGAQGTIQRFRPVILCELNDRTARRAHTTVAALIQLIERLGYRMEMLEPHHTLEMEHVDALFLPK